MKTYRLETQYRVPCDSRLLGVIQPPVCVDGKRLFQGIVNVENESFDFGTSFFYMLHWSSNLAVTKILFGR